MTRTRKLYLRWMYVWGSLKSVKHGFLPWMKCSRCKRRKLSEQIIVGEGWCFKCWDWAFESWPKDREEPVARSRATSISTF